MLPSLTKKVLPLVTNYGRRKFAIALVAGGFQGALLTLGVASTCSLLAVASDVSLHVRRLERAIALAKSKWRTDPLTHKICRI